MRRSSATAFALVAGLCTLGRPPAARAQQPVFDLPGIGAAALETEDTGYEYVNVLRDAWDLPYEGSAEALRVLFGLTPVFESDAAKAAHASVLAALLQERGDETFAAVLSREPVDVRRAVLRALSSTARSGALDRFPRTAALRSDGDPGR